MLISKVSNSPVFKGRMLMDKAKVAREISYIPKAYHEDIIREIYFLKRVIERNKPEDAVYVFDAKNTLYDCEDTETRERNISQGFYITLTNPENQAEYADRAIELYDAKIKYDSNHNVVEQECRKHTLEPLKSILNQFINFNCDFDKACKSSEQTMDDETREIFDKLA